jgi:hypothetical protein
MVAPWCKILCRSVIVALLAYLIHDPKVACECRTSFNFDEAVLKIESSFFWIKHGRAPSDH